MAVLDSPLTTYSDTTPQKRVITDYISMIDPHDSVAVDILGGLDGGASKFRFVNGMATVVEWLEDTLIALTDALNGSITSTVTTITVTDGSIFQPGHVILIDSEQMWVSAVNTSTEVLTVTRNYSGTQATHADTTAIEIVGLARLEGDDSDPIAFTDRTTNSNYTQILHHEVKVTRSQQQTPQYGIASEFDYQEAKGLVEISRLIEKQLYLGARKAGSATTPRAFGGFGTFITDNTVSAGGAVVKQDFIDAAQASFDDGGTGPWKAFVNSANKEVISTFLDTSTLLRVTQQESQAGMVVDSIKTDFGQVDIVLDRWARDDKIYMVDPMHAGMVTFYPFTYEPLAKDGDYDKGEVVGEFTLCVRQDKAHAVITSIS